MAPKEYLTYGPTQGNRWEHSRSQQTEPGLGALFRAQASERRARDPGPSHAQRGLRILAELAEAAAKSGAWWVPLLGSRRGPPGGCPVLVMAPEGDHLLFLGPNWASEHMAVGQNHKPVGSVLVGRCTTQKPMAAFWSVGAPPVLGFVLVGVGMFTRSTT